jgi:phosphoinositide-3-kinase regulatory subunit 4
MLHSSLSGRISKPKLNFIAMQILVAVNTLHNLKLYHGNIRTSNVLLTYNDHVALADFSPFKPYYLRED